MAIVASRRLSRCAVVVVKHNKTDTRCAHDERDQCEELELDGCGRGVDTRQALGSADLDVHASAKRENQPGLIRVDVGEENDDGANENAEPGDEVEQKSSSTGEATAVCQEQEIRHLLWELVVDRGQCCTKKKKNASGR